MRQIPLLDSLLEGQLRSGKGPAARVVMINLTRRFYIGYVLDRNGRREENFTLAVGEGFILPCEAKDCFLMTEKEGKPLGAFVAGTGANLLVVTESEESARFGMPRDPDYADQLIQAVAARGPAKAAQAFLAQLESRMPDDPKIHRAIGNAYARWGLWDKAANALAQQLRRDDVDHWDWVCAAILSLKRGDAKEYRQLCRRMLDRFATTDDPMVAEHTASICLLSAERVDDQGRPEQLAERAVKAGGEPASLKRFQQARALAEYRQARYTAALAWLEKSRTLDAGPAQRELEPETLLIGALAHHRLGHTSEAARSFEQARGLIERLPAPGQPDYAGPWTDWLICESLRLEAERLLGAASPGTAGIGDIPTVDKHQNKPDRTRRNGE
jgi:tetratricopeptide (TPR) repeat protein